ncbi:MAG TPA: two-component regulator propeller domain-containing protein [Pyrinomonadaceae bacterium]|nr:two-component regulator propeller domain-containing protein [Pyrinomonadaceae bacterium]
MKRFEQPSANLTPCADRSSVLCRFPLCLLLLLIAAIPAAALDPNKLITQYGHTAWRVQDGDLTNPAGITQTRDGYIWIGTAEGLMRFDGVRFTLWTPPEGQSLPGRGFASLLGSRDGSLWIGTTSGLAQLKDGRLTSYASPQGGGGVGAIIEDETGAIWFTRYRIADGKGPLCRVKDGELRCFGKEDGVPVTYGLGLAKDSAGNLWFGSSVLCRWSPGSSEVYFEEELKRAGGEGVIDVAAGQAGQIWAALDGTGTGLGVRHYSGGKWSSYAVSGFNGSAVRSHTLYMDRNNSLWVGTTSEGLYHIHDGVADRYGMEHGLSGKSVSHMYEDRESNLWVVTENGVDMFRDTPVVSFTTSEGLSAGGAGSVLALRDGSIWVGNQAAIDIIRPGGRTAITQLKGLPGPDVGAMYEDSAGRVWLGAGNRLLIYERGRFIEVEKPDGSPLGRAGSVWAVTEDSGGDIWVCVFLDNKRRLMRIRGQTLQEEVPLDEKIRRAEFLAADRQGGIWIGSHRDKVMRYRNGQMEIVSLEKEGTLVIYGLWVDSEDALWVPTAKGLYRWKDGGVSLLESRNGLPCSAVYAALEDNGGNFWLYARCGLLKVAASDMLKWRSQTESKVSVQTFDALDGALPSAGDVRQPRASKSPDGRLWFISNRAVQMIDPGRPYANPVSPPVQIEGLVADRRNYQVQEPLNLPPLKGELEINYTALSLTIPRKVRFRYKLEGHDADWQEVGGRRQAFYNNLAPGNYRFRVMACNNDGAWNESGAALAFHIEPTLYQTTYFRLLIVLAVALATWGLYRFRIRQVSRVISARFDERLAERTRLARELHDTFLQTVQGSKMVADDALDQPDDPARLRRAMEQLSGWLGQAVQEGRTALNSLRTSATETNDLAEAFRRATVACQLPASMTVAFSVVGEARNVHPVARDEVYRIGYEAIRNACRHSQASRLEVELRYAQDLSVRVRDNGIGINPVVAATGRDGHFGLKGMRERAERIGGNLTINSSADAGTEIRLVVPGGAAFRKADSPRLEM